MQPSPKSAARRPAVARIACWSARHSVVTVLAWVALALAAFFGGKLLGTVSQPQYDPGQSGTAERMLSQLHVVTPDAESVLITPRHAAPGETFATDAQLRQTAGQVVAALRARPWAAAGIRSPDGPGGRALVSPDGRSALVTFDVAGPHAKADTTVAADQAAVASVQARHPGLIVAEAGQASTGRAANTLLSHDFRQAGFTSGPITLVLLLVVFGALIAAGIPVLLAGSAVVITVSLLAIPSRWLPIGQGTAEIVLIIGMAVGVDYTLFYLRREREERAAGASFADALATAAATSGRAIVVSGLTVMVCMAGLFLTGIDLFTGFAFGTIAVIGVAVAGALTVLPALLSLLGPWADRGRIPFLGKARTTARPSRLWTAVVSRVVRRPVLWGGLAVAALVALALPALGMRTQNPAIDLPPNLPVVRTLDQIQRAFPGGPSPAEVVVAGPGVTSPAMRHAVAALAARASAGGAIRPPVTAATVAHGRAVVVSVPLAGSGTNSVSYHALLALRNSILPATVGAVPRVSYAVTGTTANGYDFSAALRSSVPLVFTVVAALAFLLLLVAFRSLTIPLMSILLNLLSVGAAYGLITLVFQHGYLAGLLGVTSSGGDHRLGAAVHVRVPVRPEHGLPRVHPQPDPRAEDRRDDHAGRRDRRHREQRRRGHQRRRDHGGGVLHLRDAVHGRPQDHRGGAGLRGVHRRDRRARHLRPGRARPPRRAELVPPPPAALGLRWQVPGPAHRHRVACQNGLAHRHGQLTGPACPVSRRREGVR
jgi:putative drug exporter of the RND superfamily